MTLPSQGPLPPLPPIPMPPRPPAPPRAAAVVLGAGSGSRVGAGRNKVLLEVAGRPVLAHSVRTALAVPDVACVVLVVRPGEEDEVLQALAPHLAPTDEVLVVPGGATRQASEQAALQVLRPRVVDGSVDVVAIHDGARPLADVALWSTTVGAARERGGALPVRQVTGLVRRADATRVPALGGVQTPQAFRADLLLSAYDAARAEGFEGTDTAATLERYSPEVQIAAVTAPPENIKVTFAPDLALADTLLRQRPPR